MANLTKRLWRTWAGTTLVPLLEWPPEWVASGRDWTVTDETVAASPTSWLAQGLAYSRTRSGEWFEAYAWVMPLYVAFPHVALTWSRQLKSIDGTRGLGFATPSSRTDAAVAKDLARAFNRDGLPHLDRVGSLEGFRDRALEQQAKLLAIHNEFWHAEEVGYTHLLLGDHASAETQLARQNVSEDDDESEGVTASRRRCATILELLQRDPELAKAQLAEWAAETARSLGLEWHGGQ